MSILRPGCRVKTFFDGNLEEGKDDLCILFLTGVNFLQLHWNIGNVTF